MISMEAKGSRKMEFDECRLEKVLYVSDLNTNLLSVNAITTNGGEVLFSKDEVIISHKNKTVLKGKKLPNGLFQVKLKSE